MDKINGGMSMKKDNPKGAVVRCHGFLEYETSNLPGPDVPFHLDQGDPA